MRISALIVVITLVAGVTAPRRPRDSQPKKEAQLTIVGIIVVIILILLAIYLFRRVA